MKQNVCVHEITEHLTAGGRWLKTTTEAHNQSLSVQNEIAYLDGKEHPVERDSYHQPHISVKKVERHG